MIEAVSVHNIDQVLPLISAYQQFYKMENISAERNRKFFASFGKTSPWGCQFLFRKPTGAVAFATVYFSFATSITAKVGILNDLYTHPDHRGEGIAKQLIEHCRAYAATQGCARLQWVTAKSNTQAQALYNTLTTTQSEWLFYTYNT